MKRPRNLLPPGRRCWDAMVKMLVARGVNPETCRDLLEDYVRLAGEESDLENEWDEVDLQGKLALGRRFSAILREKLKLRELLLNSPKLSDLNLG